MTSIGIPFILEDKTGDNAGSDFDEIYDRMFLRTKSMTTQNAKGLTTCIYDEGRRSSTLGSYYGKPLVVLDFAANNGLGKVTFVELSSSMSMESWIRRTSFFGKSLTRKFRASDGQEYKWTFRPSADKEWLCTNMNNYPVAHYTLGGRVQLAYRTSGNVFTIYESYGPIALELLASLIIMRHIQQHNL